MHFVVSLGLVTDTVLNLFKCCELLC